MGKNEIPARALIDVPELSQLKKDRLDFGFDSIYFRYSELVEELSWYKEMEARRSGDSFNRKAWCESHRMHFYNCLEQLVQAHCHKEDIYGFNS